jgi:hypothetical protein
MSNTNENGQSTKQSSSTGVVATEPSTGGSAVPRKKFAITATLEAPKKPVAVEQIVSGGCVASEKPNGACAAGGGSVATKKPTRACAGGGGGGALPKNSVTVSKVATPPPPKKVMSEADELQAMIDAMMLEDEKKTSEAKSKPKKPVSAAWTGTDHTGFIQQTKAEAELLSAISSESEEVSRNAERAKKEAELAKKEAQKKAELAHLDEQKKAERAKKAEDDLIAQQISVEAVKEWERTSKVLKERLENAKSKRKAPKFAIVQKSAIKPTSELYPACQAIKAELAEITAEIAKLTKLIEFHGERPETFQEIQAKEAKAQIEKVKELRDSHHALVAAEFKPKEHAPIRLFKETINSFMSADNGGIRVIFFDRFSHRKIGTFNNVCIDPDVFAKIFLRTKDGNEISVFTVDYEKKIVSISEELIAHMRRTYKQNPKLPFGEYLFYAMREAVYYFLTKFAKQVAFVQGIQLWQLFTNVRRLDEKFTEQALEHREEELRELWASIASSRQSASEAETTAPPPSNPFHVLADTVDCPPEAVTVDCSQEAAPVVPWTDPDIQHACEVIRPMIDASDSSLVSRVGGFASDPPAFKNPTLMGSPQAFREFMDAIPQGIRGDRNQALAFLQAAGLIAKEITTIKTKNGFKNVYLFLDVHGEPLRREDPVPRFVPAAGAEFTAETATAVAVSADEFVLKADDVSNATATDGSTSAKDE